MKIRTIFSILIILAGLNACATGGTKLTDDQVSQFKVGTATIDEVETGLGKPTIVKTNSDGTKVATYQYEQSSPKPQNFIPLVGVFVAAKTVEVSKVDFTFGADGKLTNVTRSEGKQDISRF